MNETTYTCFYTNKPFWAIEHPNLDDPGFLNDFTNKMSEIVFTQDIDGLRLRIARDGLIELRDQSLETKIKSKNETSQFQKITQIWSEYLMLANSVFLLLDMATDSVQNNITLFDFQEITRKDAFRISYQNGKFYSSGFPMGSVSGAYYIGRYLYSYNSGIPLSIDTRMSLRQVVEKKTLCLLSEYILHTLQVKGLLEKLYSLAKSLSEYKIGNYKVSIVLCWFVIEEILNEKYTELLNNKNYRNGEKKRINGDRMSLLTGRDFTSSIVSNILELSDIISLDDLVHIDKVRKMRNDIAHGINRMKINSNDCVKSLEFTSEFFVTGCTSFNKAEFVIVISGSISLTR